MHCCPTGAERHWHHEQYSDELGHGTCTLPKHLLLNTLLRAGVRQAQLICASKAEKGPPPRVGDKTNGTGYLVIKTRISQWNFS